MKQLARKTLFYGGIMLVLYMIFFLFFDKELSHYVYAHLAGTPAQQLAGTISLLAYGGCYKLIIAICFILIVMNALTGFLSAKWTKFVLFICVSLCIAIVLGDGIKYLLGRYRPIMGFEQDLYGFHFFSSKWELNSSPSGHTIRAFTLFTSLSLLIRRLTPIFITVAIIIGISRVIVTAHYPGDVIFGAYIGVFTSMWVYYYSGFKPYPTDGSQIDHT